MDARQVVDLAAGVLLLREAGAEVESEPDLEGIDPATYARGLEGDAPRITFFARSCAELPSLRGFLEPIPPLP